MLAVFVDVLADDFEHFLRGFRGFGEVEPVVDGAAHFFLHVELEASEGEKDAGGGDDVGRVDDAQGKVEAVKQNFSQV